MYQLKILIINFRHVLIDKTNYKYNAWTIIKILEWC